MIKIENLQKVFDNGDEALKSINIEIQEGELVSLLGPSGCGKTTILNLVAGLLDPTKGDIKFDENSVINLHPKDRGIGLVFQNYALYPHMTVLENVMFPLTVGKNKKSKQEAEKISREYMKITDIEELANKKPGTLSGGQQQRVAITRALVQNPRVLLLDEPLSNLDARLRLKIREEIRRLVKKIGITTIFVTHDQEEALSISDKIVLMDKGVVQQHDIPQNLYLDPENLFVAKFMGNPIINTYEVELSGENFVGEKISFNKNNLVKNNFRKELEDGGKYILGIRPEYFKISEKPILKTKVESIELIGRDTIVNFYVGEKISKLILDSKYRVQVEDELNIDLDYEHIYIFEENGGRVY